MIEISKPDASLMFKLAFCENESVPKVPNHTIGRGRLEDGNDPQRIGALDLRSRADGLRMLNVHIQLFLD